MSESKPLGPQLATERGFPIVRFKDYGGNDCSIQCSSLWLGYECGTSALWLGTDDAKPQVLWSDAARAGVPTNQKCGWVPFPLPEGVRISTRMHLDREQVAGLCAHLMQWLETGQFE